MDGSGQPAEAHEFAAGRWWWWGGGGGGGGGGWGGGWWWSVIHDDDTLSQRNHVPMARLDMVQHNIII